MHYWCVQSLYRPFTRFAGEPSGEIIAWLGPRSFLEHFFLPAKITSTSAVLQTHWEHQTNIIPMDCWSCEYGYRRHSRRRQRMLGTVKIACHCGKYTVSVCNYYSITDTVCNAPQYTVCSVQCAECSVQCVVCSVQCAVCSTVCSVCSVQLQCAVYSIQ
jgi:hypothetical protein